MMRAGVGARCTLSLGGKLDMPAHRPEGPAAQRARPRAPAVRRPLPQPRPDGARRVNHMGPTAVLDTGKVEIVVISNHVEPHDLAAFQAVGIDPASKRYLMLKSRVHWRAGSLRRMCGPGRCAVVECAGTGVCTSDYAALPSTARAPADLPAAAIWTL
jgi:microcystin degradation protein MlrC